MPENLPVEPSFSPPRSKGQRRILFYDGQCGLCTRTVRFFLVRDRAGLIYYAPLLGETARQLLPKELREPGKLSTVVYLIREGAEAQIEYRSAAVAAALYDLGGLWRLLSKFLLLIPAPLREWGYRLVARHRLKFFRKGACDLPTKEEAHYLLD